MIPMQISSEIIHNVEFLAGSYEILKAAGETPALPVFSDGAVSFLADLSREILKDRRSGEYADVISYAYWIRRASLESEKKLYTDGQNRIGRGTAFHIAPSNVPVNFAVSMTSSLLAGNITVIRVSDKKFVQADIIIDAVNQLLAGCYRNMQPYLCIVRYAHSASITQELSSICDIRIVWGGNRTVETIRKAALPPRAVEMAFADRYSIAVIDADVYLQSDAEETAKSFYTDTYYTDQNACSSPRLVVWLGNAVEQAKERFWTKLNDLAVRDYDMQPVQSVDKYTSFCMLAMRKKDIRLVSAENYVMRVSVDKLDPDLMEYKNGGGYFFEYRAKELEEIVPLLGKQCQTVAVLGISNEEIKKLVFDYGVRGVDRIVPLGKTMELSFIWDGYQMIDSMSRYVYL